MIGANAIGHGHFTDLREIARRTELFMVDSQSRDTTDFEQNSLNGVLLHQLVGWDKVIPESSASYSRGYQAYRRGASTSLELHLWMLEGIAGGISPWWHIIGSAQEDKRIFGLHQPVLEWHKKYETYLYNRKPTANIGLVWSQDNVEFGSGLLEKNRVQDAWRGIVMALTRAGLPFLPVNAGDLNTQTKDMDLLILSEFAVVADEEAKALEAFVERGGSIFACGETGIFGMGGDERGGSALEALFGLQFGPVAAGPGGGSSFENPVFHNYLRIEAADSPIFNGYENTAMLPMGGILKEIIPGKGVRVLATYIPVFPMYPPEFAWTAQPKTDKPVLTEYSHPKGGKAVYAAWDLDAVYGRAAHPDHGDLIASIIKYLLGDKIPVLVECDAYIDFKIYSQEERLIIHLINSNHSGFAQGYAEKNLPVGPVKISVKLPGFAPAKVWATEDKQEVKISRNPEGGFTLTLQRLGVHQLIIAE
jgi:hypothetical protein